MTRHYKLSTGSNHGNEGRGGRSSLCERYGRDWASVGKDGNLSARSHCKEVSSDTSFQSPAPPPAPMGGTGGTWEEGAEAGRHTPPLSPAPVASEPRLSSPGAVSRERPSRLCDWSVEDVLSWATSTALPAEALDLLRENDINGNVLRSLTEADLVDMAISKPSWRRTLLSERKELFTRLLMSAPAPPAVMEAQTARPHAVAGKSDASPAPGRATLQRTPSSLRSSAGTLPPAFGSARSPVRIADLPTPARAGASTARAAPAKTLAATPVQAAVCGSLSFTPLPKKPGFSPPVGSVTPLRSASAVRVRPQASHESPLAVGATPRSASCIRTRIQHTPLWATPTLSAVPVVSATVASAVSARPPMHPLDLQVTVRPLSPSSGRVRQAPPCRRVRSIDHLERVVGTRPLSPSSGRVRQARAGSPRPAASELDTVRRADKESGEAAAPPAPDDASSARSDAVGEEPARAGAQSSASQPRDGTDSIFGAAASSWGRVCQEMEKTIEEDFQALRRQVSARFDQEHKASAAEAPSVGDGPIRSEES